MGLEQKGLMGEVYSSKPHFRRGGREMCGLNYEDFEKAAKDALTLPATTTDEDKLILYGLYKTATVGKVNTSRPGMFDPKGKYKWDAWKAVEGKSKEEAMKDYITKVTQLKEA